MERLRFSSVIGRLVRLAGPIVIGQLGVVLVSFADTFMVGHYGVDELAAASFVNNVTMLLVVVGLGFSLGITPLVSESEGRGDMRRAGAWLRCGLQTNAVLAGIMAAVMAVLYFNLGNMGQPQELLPLIRPYFVIVSFSILTTYFFNAFKQFTDGITRTKVSMVFIIGSNILNILGNWVLIYGKAGFPELGLRGAGISTLVSRIAVLCAMAAYFAFRKDMAAYRDGFRHLREKGMLRRSASLGLPIGAQMGMESASFSLIVIMVGWLGATELAAHQVMGTLSQICFMLYIAVGSASAIMISSFKSRGMYAETALTAKAAYLTTAVLTVICAGFILTFSGTLVSMFTDSDEVSATVMTLLLPFTLYQFGDGLQICFANALRGMQQVRPILPVAFVSYFIISLPSSYLFGFVLDGGLAGIWFGYPISLTFAGISYYLIFSKIQKKLPSTNDHDRTRSTQLDSPQGR